MKSPVVVFYFVVLQVLWLFRLLYEFFVPETQSDCDKLDKQKIQIADDHDQQKRHLIHLVTSDRKTGRPVCYMDVCEIISPLEEEMLRCACAKGVPNKTFPRHKHGHKHPRISRSNWMGLA